MACPRPVWPWASSSSLRRENSLIHGGFIFVGESAIVFVAGPERFLHDVDSSKSSRMAARGPANEKQSSRQTQCSSSASQSSQQTAYLWLLTKTEKSSARETPTTATSRIQRTDDQPCERYKQRAAIIERNVVKGRGVRISGLKFQADFEPKFLFVLPFATQCRPVSSSCLGSGRD
jgi:hypothetical protein